MLNIIPIPQPYPTQISAENEAKINSKLLPLKGNLTKLIGDYGNLAVENIVDPVKNKIYWQISFSHKRGKYVLVNTIENLNDVFIALDSILDGIEFLAFLEANRKQPY